MKAYRTRAGGAVLGFLLLHACAPGRPSPVGGNACLTVADTTVARLDTVVVALSQPESERFLIRHTSANLVRSDCTGGLGPELATRWEAEDSGKSWIFTLGSVTAGAVRDAWDARRNGGIWPWPAMLEVDALDSARLRVRLDRAYPELPAEFADPGLAIGPGRFRIQLAASPRAGPVTVVTYLVPAMGPGPVIKVEQLRPGVDPRDALDFPRAGALSPADVVIASDAATVAYARSRPEFAVFQAGWPVSYVLLTPMPISPSTGLGRISDAMRLGLVKDVVPGKVRAALVPHWSDSLPCLSAFKAPDPTIAGGPLIAFNRNDPVARALAERIAAVAVAHSGPRTVAMSPSGLDSAIATGPANAFVLPLPRQRPATCAAVTSWPHGSTVDPLVDLLTFVITRRSVPPLLLDGDGMIRITPAAGP